MYELIIQNYINNLTKDEVLNFALKNNINLSLNELNYVFNVIKKDYKTLLSNNYEKIFINSKDFLTNENYNKIKALYLNYRANYGDMFKTLDN